MRKGDPLQHLNVLVVGPCKHGGMGFRRSIHDEHCRTVKRRNQHRTGRMTEMMVQEHGLWAGGSVNLSSEVASKKDELPPLLGHSLCTSLPLHPTELRRPQHRPEGQSPPPTDLPILPGYRDGIDITEAHTGRAETIANRLHRQRRDMLHPNEPFFFCRSNHSAILDQRCSGIPHVRQTKYQHQYMPLVFSSSPYEEGRIAHASQARKALVLPVAFSMTFRYGADRGLLATKPVSAHNFPGQ